MNTQTMNTKKIGATIALTLGLAAASNAALSLTNGAFDNATNWTAQTNGSPTGWSASTQGQNTSYGEAITGYGSGKVAAFKDTYPGQASSVQQTIGLVGEQTGVTVDFLGGYRYHSSYNNTTARDILIKVSLWDVTDDVELASVTMTYAYDLTGGTTSLTSESETLNYTIGAAGANDLALRFENISNAGTPETRDATAIVDTVSITAAVPEPSSAALLGLGGLALILRRRK